MPRLTALFPAGLQRGSVTEVSLAGENLEGLSGLLFSHPGLTATIAGGKAKINVAANSPTGFVDAVAVGSFGASNPRPLWISSLPGMPEKEPNSLSAQANALPLDTFVDGRMDARADVDYFQVQLKKGQRIVVQVFAERLDSRMAPVLTLLDTSGTLASNFQYFGRDPLIDFVAPADGPYLIRLHDLVYNGSGDYFYRLIAGTVPAPEFAYPPVVAAGTRGNLVIYGRGAALGAGDPLALVDGQPLERFPFTVEPSSSASSSRPLPGDFRRLSRSAFLELFELRQTVMDSLGGCLPVAISREPVTVEREPNDNAAAAVPMTNPGEAVGRLDRPGDSDWFRFTAKAAVNYRIETISERMGFPCDTVLWLQRVLPAKGSVAIATEDIGEVDDGLLEIGGFKFPTGGHDSLRIGRLPADGDYLVQVRDRYGEIRGDARFVYRLRIVPEEPDFQLVVLATDPENPSGLAIRQGGTLGLSVLAARYGGFSEPIALELAAGPPGVTMPSVVIGTGQTTGLVVLSADMTMPAGAAAFAIRGSALIGGKPTIREASFGTIIWPSAATGPKPARLTALRPLATRDKAPYRLMASPREFLVGQGAQLNIDLRLARHWPDFAGPLEGITGQSLPPGIDNATVAIPAKGMEGRLHLYVKPDAPPGTYTFAVAGTGQVPFTKTPADPKAAKANIPVADPSDPVRLTIVQRPVELVVDPKTPAIKAGAKGTVKVTVRRHNGFAGPVRLSLVAPPGSGLAAAETVVAPDKGEAAIEIAVAAGTPAGDKASLSIRGTVDLAGRIVYVDDRITPKVP